MLTPGSRVPDVVLTNQHGDTVDLASLRGRRVLIFFYPKANTPGCTQQACGLRDVAGEVAGTVIVGISPDKPAAQKKFDDKFSLGFDLLSDAEHSVAQAFGVWQEKHLYGKRYMGIVRSAFLVDAGGIVEHVWYKISPADTPKRLLEAVGR
ncbi:MAG: thioredoxin-dependent thiol peroxidase [Ilumatobacteraceae bacterium]